MAAYRVCRVTMAPTTSASTARNVVASPPGVSNSQCWRVREEKAAGRLACLRIAGHQLKRSVAMLALGRFQPSPTRAFLAYILEHKGELQEAARAV